MNVLRLHRPLMLLAAVMAVLVVFALGGILVDDRVLTGIPVWAKVAKFALSVLIYALTWAWLIGQLTRWRRTAWWAATVAAAGLGIELIVIVIQVVRGTTSHFNFTTPLNSALWELMGASIIVVWIATLVVSLTLFRNPIPDSARNAAIRYGAMISLLGAALGLLMVAPTQDQRDTQSSIRGAHTVGPADGGPGVPLLGWSTAGGDLRIPHFLGMHAIQLLPVALLALEYGARRFAALNSETLRAGLIRIGAATYIAGLAVLTWQALRGQSVFRPDPVTLAAAGFVLICAASASVSIIRRRLAEPRQPISVGATP